MYIQKPNSKKKKRFFTLLFGIFLILGLLVCGVFIYCKNDYLKQSLTPVDLNQTGSQVFQIEKNENMKILAKRLKDDGLIKNDFYFWWYLRSNDLIPKIQAGTHYLSKSYDYAKIVQELSKARPKEINITIPEGYRIDQIDQKLVEDGLINAGDFIEVAKSFDFSDYAFLENENLEGYLFPDTYRVFSTNFQSQNLILKMLQNFENKINSIYDSEKETRSLAEIMIMASILEKETNNKDDRAIVAGILWKRLEIGMLLGADATTRYGVGKFTGALTEDDLKSDSPYNTRKIRGLPPTPICNAGLKSIQATINPKESDYLYYLHDENGDIHYAKDNTEHNANKRKYL